MKTRSLFISFFVIILVLIALPPAFADSSSLTITGDSVSGLVFDDLNGDGEYGWSVAYGEEPALSSVGIQIYRDQGILAQIDNADVLVAQAKTNEQGIFQFKGLAGGSYLVVENDLTNFVSVTANVIAVTYIPEAVGSTELQIFFADRQVDRSQLSKYTFLPLVR